MRAKLLLVTAAVVACACGTTTSDPIVSKDQRVRVETSPVASVQSSGATAPIADPQEPPIDEPATPPDPPPPPPPVEVVHASPDGIPERCALLQRFPFEPPDLEDDPGSMRWYRDDDFEDIGKLCKMDFYADRSTDTTTAMGTCPKTHWTTPALELYDLTETKLTKAKWEELQCPRYRRRNIAKLAKLKIPVYSKESESALLYFHFSRLLGNAGFVYPTTAREIARPEWVKLAHRAVAAIGKHKVETTLGAWGLLRNRHKQKKRTPDVVMGSLAKNPRGEHSHMTFRGTSFAIFKAILFRKTYYYKLVNDLDPILDGLDLDPTDPGAYHKAVQRLTYAEDFVNLVVMDYVFNARDRNGNIEAKHYAHYTDDAGHLRWKSEDKADKLDHPVVLERLILKDNDDGVVWDKFGKLNMSPIIYELHHMDPTMYGRMQWLAGLMIDEDSNAILKKFFVESVRVRDFLYDEVQYRFVKMADRFAKMYANGDLLLDIDLAAAVEAAPPLPPDKKKKGKKKKKKKDQSSASPSSPATASAPGGS